MKLGTLNANLFKLGSITNNSVYYGSILIFGNPTVPTNIYRSPSGQAYRSPTGGYYLKPL